MKSELIDWNGGKVRAYEVSPIQRVEPKRNAVILLYTGDTWAVSIECKDNAVRDILTAKARELIGIPDET